MQSLKFVTIFTQLAFVIEYTNHANLVKIAPLPLSPYWNDLVNVDLDLECPNKDALETGSNGANYQSLRKPRTSYSRFIITIRLTGLIFEI